MLISEISREENIPIKFLEVILLELKNHGYLESKKGKRGGYWLAKKPEEIFLGNIVRLLDGPLAPTLCVSLTAYKPCNECIDVAKCNVRLLMRDVRNAISEILDKRTIRELMENNQEVYKESLNEHIIHDR